MLTPTHLRALYKLQRFARAYLLRKSILALLRRLSTFRGRLLAVYKGWVVRAKVLKNPAVRQIIRDIRGLRGKGLSLAFLRGQSSAIIA